MSRKPSPIRSQSYLLRQAVHVWIGLGLVLIAGAAASCATSGPAADTPAPIPAPPPRPQPPAPVQAASGFTPDATLSLCARLTVSNSPAVDADRRVEGFKPYLRAENAVTLAVVPTSGACLSSGFGERNGRPHKGIDVQARPAGMVYAAGDGVVIERNFRKDYGHQVVIDHGSGVFTRYAHLVSNEQTPKPGEKIAFGAPLGVMGNTAETPVAVHLHYEILTGEYVFPKGTFGLTAQNPLRYPYRERR